MTAPLGSLGTVPNGPAEGIAADPSPEPLLTPSGSTMARGEERLDLPQSDAVRATIEPLWQRLRLGEGGLIGMATWAAAWASKDVATTVDVFLLTTLLLVAVYLYNDVSDRVIDALNPKKIARNRKPLLERPRLFLGISIAVHIATCIATLMLLGPWPAACATSLLLLNPFYSAVAKGVAALDVVVVGAMGAAVIGLATSSPSLLVMSAAMTGISHAFQTRVDVKADVAAGVYGSGTAPAALRRIIWVSLAVAFALTLYNRLGPVWTVSAIVPYVLLSSGEPNRAWGWARMYFAAIWIVATIQ